MAAHVFQEFPGKNKPAARRTQKITEILHAKNLTKPHILKSSILRNTKNMKKAHVSIAQFLKSIKRSVW